MKFPVLTILFVLFVLPAIYIFNSSPSSKVQSVAPAQVPFPTASQLIKATYGPPFGFVPTELTVKAGIPVRLEVYATENGRGCMGSIMLPDFLPGNIQGFTKDQTNIFEFTPTTPGTYYITCAMGIPHATIVVN